MSPATAAAAHCFAPLAHTLRATPTHPRLALHAPPCSASHHRRSPRPAPQQYTTLDSHPFPFSPCFSLITFA
ncbi:hypothetical protein HYPSUDRAFT_205686 [Hypholoma sublateritium FD-334 SS-4]|uniref:Uncharacterized protein n=1 Tax=Hypholoma sublateritium (strain FD-334 SS-4) TaxID=945553 RepID=A0A0D2M4H5_HYPSF|nr:hypothetical protein HYPSUDRAFT_205686 [Hypholoma sublateritium FD-334 SS-4]